MHYQTQLLPLSTSLLLYLIRIVVWYFLLNCCNAVIFEPCIGVDLVKLSKPLRFWNEWFCIHCLPLLPLKKSFSKISKLCELLSATFTQISSGCTCCPPCVVFRVASWAFKLNFGLITVLLFVCIQTSHINWTLSLVKYCSIDIIRFEKLIYICVSTFVQKCWAQEWNIGDKYSFDSRKLSFMPAWFIVVLLLHVPTLAQTLQPFEPFGICI